MKESKENKTLPIIATHYPLSENSDVRKPWMIAARRSNHEMQKEANRNTEAKFHEIVAAAKHLKPEDVFYEHDYRYEERDNQFVMHFFLMRSFFIYLECDSYYDYKVRFAFDYCPFENEIRDLIGPFPIDWPCSEVPFDPDFECIW